jgi:protein SCO1/2
MIRWFAPLLCLSIGCSHTSKLPTYGVVPDFELTAQDGHPFHSASELKGKIWVADFIFTNCPGVCPRMTSQMHQVQQAVAKMPDVRLVSFTIDPARDTPEVLTAYAMLHHASPDRWRFLTGPIPTLNHLDRDVFLLGNVDSSLTHSTRFVLVDKQSHIRGFYDSSEADRISKLIAAIRALERS